MFSKKSLPEFRIVDCFGQLERKLNLTSCGGYEVLLFGRRSGITPTEVDMSGLFAGHDFPMPHGQWFSDQSDAITPISIAEMQACYVFTFPADGCDIGQPVICEPSIYFMFAGSCGEAYQE